MKKDKKVVIGINGFGRIGSVVLRAILMEKYEVEVGAINTTGQFDIETFMMQFKYDSVYGRFPAKVSFSEDSTISVNLLAGALHNGQLSGAESPSWI